MYSWTSSPTQAHREAEREAKTTEEQANRHKVRVDDALRQIERLTLACQSMWELLRDHSDLTEDHLKAKMLEVDARDGMIDGKISHEIIDCPACGQKTNTRRPFCVFCGQTIENPHAFK